MPRRFIVDPAPHEIPDTADVVIIGGGPAGTAALWALERAEPSIRAVLIERSDRLGAGSTLASLENYRTSWPAVCLARQMRRGTEVFLNADDYLGEGASDALAVKQRGYLYCGFTKAQAETLRQEVEHLHRIGVEHVQYLEADEIAHRYHWLGERVIAAKFDPIAGWLDSNALIYRYVQSAKNAKVLLSIRDTRIKIKGGRVTGVTTPNGEIAAPHVVIAAGAASRQVGRTAGIEIPIVARPRQSFTTSTRHEGFPQDAPTIIGAAPHPHVRPEAREGAIFGWEYHWNTKRFNRTGDETTDYLADPVASPDQLKDPRFPSITLYLLARQFGHQDGEGFADPRYLRGLMHNAGYYVYRAPDNTYTTDEHGQRRSYQSQRAIIGPWQEIDGLFLSVAHVGHGIMASPAAGEIVAAYILGRELPDPSFAQFGVNVHWVEHDGGGL